jgi:TPR repeat protein
MFEAARYSHPLAQLVLGRKARQNRDCDSATVFLKLAAESGPMVRSLMGTGLKAAERGKSKQALLYYLLAAHAGVEAAQQNAAHLYLHELPKRLELQAERSQRAKDLFTLAAKQGSADAEVQLGNMLVGNKEYRAAAEMYQDAARKGSKDALFHLGTLYWRGDGVAADKNEAWRLWKESDFQSKHARQQGVNGALASAARWATKSKDALLLAAGLGFLVTKGAEIPGLADLLKSRPGGGAWDDEDMFGDEE